MIEKVNQWRGDFSFSEGHSRESERGERGVWNRKDKKQKRAVREEKQEINLPSFSLSGYDFNLFYISRFKLFSFVSC